MLEAIVNPIFAPLLNLSSLWGIIIIAFIVTVIMTVIYKLMTDQELMKTLKQDMKALQKEVKQYRDHPKKMMEANKKMMEKNMKYMGHSMKPTLITFIPIIIIFGWLNAHMAFEPIMPGQEFTATVEFKSGTEGFIGTVTPEAIKVLDEEIKTIKDRTVVFRYRALEEGDYSLDYVFDDRTYTKDILVTNKQKYAPVTQVIKDSELKSITINNKPVKPLKIFNWEIGWLGTYIIFSIAFSMILRKILKLH